MIGVHINGVRDMRTSMPSKRANVHTIIGYYNDKTPAYFDDICDGIYDYSTQDGYNNLGTWIENAAKKHGK